MSKSRLFGYIGSLFGGVCLITATAHAVPVQTFSGLLSIGDAANGISDLVGTNFSIDGDGVFDLNLAYGGSNINSIFGWNANARAASPGSAQIITSTVNEARLFLAGELIGSGGTTTDDAILGSADTMGGTPAGAFVPSPDSLSGTSRGFIGFSFLIGGNTHFGWADVEVDLTGNFEDGYLNLYGYGYETSANSAIAAGAGVVPVPAAAWLFGSGLLGLIGMARRKKA